MPKDLSDNEYTLCEQLHKQYAEADNNKTKYLSFCKNYDKTEESEK